MNKYKSTKGVTQHFFSPDPVTIDKSVEWGEGNIQQFPEGVFLQIQNGIISHGVQPNADKTAPLGWKSLGDNNYEKLEIAAEQIKVPTVTLMTADGEMTYDNSTNDGWVCYNLIDNIKANPQDAWFVTNDKFTKLYNKI